MTVFYPFVPPQVVAYQFRPVLDGTVCTGIVKWNVFGQRLYLDLYSQDGTRIFTQPFIGSPSGINIVSISWDQGTVYATLAAPHGLRVTDTIRLTMKECIPVAYNGTVDALVTGALTLQWPLATNPGVATNFGHIDYNINLVAGYFATSTLVFNEASQQIEVAP